MLHAVPDEGKDRVAGALLDRVQHPGRELRHEGRLQGLHGLAAFGLRH